MVRDVLRFYREAPRRFSKTAPTLTLGEYLSPRRYSDAFVEHYVVPMGAAIWSTAPAALPRVSGAIPSCASSSTTVAVAARPAALARGPRRLVALRRAPRPRRFAGAFGSRRPSSASAAADGVVEIETRGRAPETFDQVVIATHSDQALRLLDDPSAAERAILGAIGYQRNEVRPPHRHARCCRRAARAWSAWNYRISRPPVGTVAVTYNMSLLQGLDGRREPFCVTLNDDGHVDPSRVIERLTYHHPVFTREAVAAQSRWSDISGAARTHYAGAYWGYGFHEDGVNSALAVCAHFGASARRPRTTPRSQRHPACRVRRRRASCFVTLTTRPCRRFATYSRRRPVRRRAASTWAASFIAA